MYILKYNFLSYFYYYSVLGIVIIPYYMKINNITVCILQNKFSFIKVTVKFYFCYDNIFIFQNQQQTVQAPIPPHSSVSQTLSAVPTQSASVGSMLNHLQHQIPGSLTSNLGLQQTLGPPTPHLASIYDR